MYLFLYMNDPFKSVKDIDTVWRLTKGKIYCK